MKVYAIAGVTFWLGRRVIEGDIVYESRDLAESVASWKTTSGGGRFEVVEMEVMRRFRAPGEIRDEIAEVVGTLCLAEDPTFPGRRCELPLCHPGMHEKNDGGTRVGWYQEWPGVTGSGS